MVTQWGMSEELGTDGLWRERGRDFPRPLITTHKNVSEATMQKVDQEIRRIIDSSTRSRAS
jgi:cell division protease FtsH